MHSCLWQKGSTSQRGKSLLQGCAPICHPWKKATSTNLSMVGNMLLQGVWTCLSFAEGWSQSCLSRREQCWGHRAANWWRARSPTVKHRQSIAILTLQNTVSHSSAKTAIPAQKLHCYFTNSKQCKNKNAYFAMAKTSSWTSNFSVRSATKCNDTRKKTLLEYVLPCEV